MTADYEINLDDKYGQLAVIDIAAEAAEHEPWFNQTLTRVNDAVVRLGVLEGRLVIDVDGQDSVTLEPQQGYTVPRGVMHCTHAPVRTAVLMVEAAGVVPTGDA